MPAIMPKWLAQRLKVRDCDVPCAGCARFSWGPGRHIVLGYCGVHRRCRQSKPVRMRGHAWASCKCAESAHASRP